MGRRPGSRRRPGDRRDDRAGDGAVEFPEAGRITALKVRSSSSDRITVQVDGEPVLELTTAVLQSAGLRVGQVITATDLVRLEQEDQPYRARSRALALLAVRDRSAAEVESRLNRLGFAPEPVAVTVAWLQERGYVDDERYAERFAAERLRSGWGERRVKTELVRRGVARELVERTLDTAADDEEALAGRDEALMAMVHRRFARQFAADPAAAERRLAGFLARRGYDWDTVAQLSRRLKEEVGAPTDPADSASADFADAAEVEWPGDD